MNSARKQAIEQPANAKVTEKALRSELGTGDEKPGTQREKFADGDRLIVLCDGVFAIATTLLVLSIQLPSSIRGEAAFNSALLDLLSNSVIFYLITFVVIASLWVEHRHMMRYIRYQNNSFVWLTLLFLVFIAFFPVTSSILQRYGYRGAIILYTLTFAGCGLSLLSLWLYASWHHRLIEPDLPREQIVSRAISLALTPVYFALSLLLLFFPVKPTTVFWSWLLLPIFSLAFRLESRKRLTLLLHKIMGHHQE